MAQIVQFQKLERCFNGGFKNNRESFDSKREERGESKGKVRGSKP